MSLRDSTLARLPFLSLVPLMALAACDGLVAVNDDAPADLGHQQAPIIGYRNSSPLPGIVKVTVAGQSDTHTGVLIGRPDVVITSARWLDVLTRPSTVTVSSVGTTQPTQSRTARFINTAANGPVSAVQVDTFTAGHARSYQADLRASAAFVGQLLRCYEYVGDTLYYADMHVSSTSGDELVMSPTTVTLEDPDAGAPCLDVGTQTVVGIASRTVTGQIRVQRLLPQIAWLGALPNLNDTRNHWASSKTSLYTTTTSGQRMCLDIPNGQAGDHAPLNAYPCHYGTNQKFWLDFRADQSELRLVSDSTGRCADVPGGQTHSGVDYQMYGCHLGANQRLDLTQWSDSAGGLKLMPSHTQGLCLSLDGSASQSTRRVEQRTCTGASDQRWYLAW